MSSTGQQVGFPQLDSHFVDEERNILYPWYRLLVALWQLSGSGQIPIFEAVYLKQVSPGVIEVYDTSTKGIVGVLRLKDQPGAAPEAQTLITSPFLFTSPGDGFFVAFSCQMEIQRGGGFHKITLTGGSTPMMKDDVVRLSWTGPIPEATWFPAG